LKKFITFSIIFLLLFIPATSFAEDFFSSFRKYKIDLSGITYYIMKTTAYGAWYIEAIDTSTTNQYRFTYSYVSGDTDYQTAWTNRAVTSGASAYKAFEDAF